MLPIQFSDNIEWDRSLQFNENDFVQQVNNTLLKSDFINEYKINKPSKTYKIADWVKYEYGMNDYHNVNRLYGEDVADACLMLNDIVDISQVETVNTNEIDTWLKSEVGRNMWIGELDGLIDFLLKTDVIRDSNKIKEYKINKPGKYFNKNEIFDYIKDYLTYPPDWDFDDDDYAEEHEDEIPRFGGMDNLNDDGPSERQLSDFIEDIGDMLSPMDTLGLWLYIFRDYDPNDTFYSIKEQVMDEFPNITKDKFNKMVSEVKEWEDYDSLNEYKVNKPNSGNYRISWYEGPDQFQQEKVETTFTNAEKLALDTLKGQYLYRKSYEYWAVIEQNLGDDTIPRYTEIERINLDPEIDGLYANVRVYDETERDFVDVKTIKL
jgi:hypothetical protein